MPVFLVGVIPASTRYLVVAADAEQARRFVTLVSAPLTPEQVAKEAMNGALLHDAREQKVETSEIQWLLPDGSQKAMYLHKTGCKADPFTGIGQGVCKCMKLEIPVAR